MGKGADVLGVTMASDQQAYARRMSTKLGNSNVNISKVNFFDLDIPDKHFNVISSVEMAEHVGIKNYGAFLRKVHRLLSDDVHFTCKSQAFPEAMAKVTITTRISSGGCSWMSMYSQV